MTQEDKELLLKDLCARLPYGVKVEYNGKVYSLSRPYLNFMCIINGAGEESPSVEKCKPYLRPMSSMTDAERTKIASMAGHFNGLTRAIEVCSACFPVVDYCYSRHLDIHGLIEKGLALEALKEI